MSYSMKVLTAATLDRHGADVDVLPKFWGHKFGPDHLQPQETLRRGSMDR